MLKRCRLALLAACLWAVGAPLMAEEGLLEVTLSYRERIAPPPDAVAEVRLLDISRTDAPATALSSQRFRLTGVPMNVTLRFDPALIDARHRYSVSAAILSQDAVLFRTTTHTMLRDMGSPGEIKTTFDLVLTKVSGAASDGPEAQRLSGRIWEIHEVRGAAVTADTPPSLQVESDSRFSLYSGCNTYVGTLETGTAPDGTGRLIFPASFAGTLMACEADREELQRDVLAAIRATTGYLRAGDLLTLTDADGAVTLRLRAR